MLLAWSDVAAGAADARDGDIVEIAGWGAPVEPAERHAYFLLAPSPCCCLACLPRDPDRAVEIFAATPMVLGDRPVRLIGRWRRLPANDPAGWRYQLRDARPADPGEGLAWPAMTRRQVLVSGMAGALAACTAGVAADPARDATARRLIADGLPIDIHSHAGRILRGDRPFEPVAEPMRLGGMAAICLAMVADSPVTQVTPDRRIVAVRQPAPGELYAWSRRAFDRVLRLVAEERLTIVTDATGLRGARGQGPSVIVAAEGADFLDRSLGRLQDAYADYKLRHLQLTHYRVNDLGDIQTEARVHGGLTDFGAEVVRECNRLGIVVDVAHGTFDLVKRVAAVTTKPLVLSHTSLTNRPGEFSRTITAEHARLVAGTGGVIGIWPPSGIFPDRAAFVQGMARMVDAAGIDHVGIGSDMLGLTSASVFPSYGELPALADAMLAGGFKPDEAAKILGGNYARVFAATVG